MQSKKKEKVYKTTPRDFVWHEMCSNHTWEDPLSSPSSLKPWMDTTRPTSSNKINFANKLSVNLCHIYISIMPIKPNTVQL